jgi:SsrA-binding protein
MQKPADKKPATETLVGDNKKARFHYEILERYEAGLVLQGTEVKSLRDAKVQLGDSYAVLMNGALWLLNAQIQPYGNAAIFMNHEPDRRRQLLVHRHELDKLRRHIEEKGRTLIPLSIYFKDGRAKVEIGLCIGKKNYDKRDSIREKDLNREAHRELRERNR